MKITLDSIVSGFKSVTKLITNFDKIEDDLNNKVLYRDNPEGEPNYMQNDLDMNSYNIINQGNPVEVSGFNWLGDWSSLTTYAVGDAVHSNGTAYIAIAASTNQTPPNGTYWQIVAEANYPTQTGNADKALTTDGSAASWGSIHADHVDFTNSGTGGVERTLQAKLEDVVNVKDFGAVGDGVTDDTVAIQAALDSSQAVEIPLSNIFICRNLVLNDKQHIILKGTLKLMPSASDGDAILIGDNVGSLVVKGTGYLDGNRTNQSGVIHTKLVNITNSKDRNVFSGFTLQNHYSDEGASETARVLRIEGGDRHLVENIDLVDFEQEGIFLESTKHSIINNITSTDSLDGSWSSVIFTGLEGTTEYNTISNITCYNNGATPVVLDSRYSNVSNVTLDTIRWQNGVNLGHSGKPADFSTVSNVVVRNLLDSINTNSAGVSIANGTNMVTIDNVIVDGSTQRGINISAGATNVKMSNLYLKDVSTGVNMFQAGKVSIRALELVGTVNYGLVKDASTDVTLIDVDLTVASTAITGSTSGITTLATTFNTADGMNGGVTLTGTAGQEFVVTNANARSYSRIDLYASNDAGAASFPYIKTYADGSFTIRILNTAAAGAFVRWRIT